MTAELRSSLHKGRASTSGVVAVVKRGSKWLIKLKSQVPDCSQGHDSVRISLLQRSGRDARHLARVDPIEVF